MQAAQGFRDLLLHPPQKIAVSRVTFPSLSINTIDSLLSCFYDIYLHLSPSLFVGVVWRALRGRTHCGIAPLLTVNSGAFILAPSLSSRSQRSRAAGTPSGTAGTGQRSGRYYTTAWKIIWLVPPTHTLAFLYCKGPNRQLWASGKLRGDRFIVGFLKTEPILRYLFSSGSLLGSSFVSPVCLSDDLILNRG